MPKAFHVCCDVPTASAITERRLRLLIDARMWWRGRLSKEETLALRDALANTQSRSQQLELELARLEHVSVCLCVCMCVCVRACARGCVYVCVQ